MPPTPRRADPEPRPAPAPEPLRDSIRAALTTSQQHLGLQRGRAQRFLAEVAPFAALDETTPAALHDLHALLTPGETVFLLGDPPPATPGLQLGAPVPCLQLLFPAHHPLPPSEPAAATIVPLGCAEADEMLALIAVAYPGYFRPGTPRMGRYFGIREGERLVSMIGERLVAAPYREISGFCTHPDAASRGLGTALLSHLLALHRAEGSVSWLYVVDSNRRALALYDHFGFETLRHVTLQRLQREALPDTTEPVPAALDPQ